MANERGAPRDAEGGDGQGSSRRSSRNRWELALVLLLSASYLAWFAGPQIGVAADDERLLSVYSFDEARHTRVLRDALDAASFRLDYDSYGHLYFNATLVVLFGLSLIEPLEDTHIIAAQRIVTVVFSLAAAVATFWLGRSFFGSAVGWLAAAGLLLAPIAYLNLSVKSHPDVPQVLFLVLGVHACLSWVESKERRHAIRAAGWAGLAFAAKYSGLFLLGLIWWAGFAVAAARPATLPSRGRVVACAVGAGLVGAAALARPTALGPLLAADGQLGEHAASVLALLRGVVACSGAAVFVLGAWRSAWNRLRRQRWAPVFASTIPMTSAVFAAAFVLTSPYSLHRLQFLKGFYEESRHVAFGHTFEETSGAGEWVEVLFSSPLLDGLAPLLMVLLALAMLARDLARDGKAFLWRPRGLLWTWVLFYFAFLMAGVSLRRSYYLLPIVPFLLVLSADAVVRIVSGVFARTRGRRVLAYGFAALVLLAGGLEVGRSAREVVRFRTERGAWPEGDRAVAFGDWLTEAYPPSTRVLYDAYTYVPPVFTNVGSTHGGTLELLRAFRPDVVIVNERVAWRFADPSRAEAFVSGPRRFREHHAYYDGLRGESLGYSLVRDLGGVRVYAK